jgi:hypothetical protein
LRESVPEGFFKEGLHVVWSLELELELEELELD